MSYNSKYSGEQVEKLLDSIKKMIVTDATDIPEYLVGLEGDQFVKWHNPHYSLASEAGDIVFYNKSTGKKELVKYSKWNITDYPVDTYVPIGVIVIPHSHDVYGTGEGAMMSLKSMSYSTPDSGQTSEQYIYWGQYNVDIESLTNYNVVVGTGTRTSPTAEATGTTSYNYMPSDNFTGAQCPTDPLSYYYGTSTTANSAAPSPYLENGARNPVYYQTSTPSTPYNMLSDFDGVGNTKVLLSLATEQSDWKTADTITNSSGSGYSPAACCCWRYFTDGTTQGDWYLPAMGELGYLCARRKAIAATITDLISAYGSSIGVNVSNVIYWSSSEYSSTRACFVYLGGGDVSDGTKDLDDCVRAWCRVPQL